MSHMNCSLTYVQVSAFVGLMGLFLNKAVSALNSFYIEPNRKLEDKALPLLLEMVGWTVTWDPAAEAPMDLLQEALTKAAYRRLCRDFRVDEKDLLQVHHHLTECFFN
jgi:hypothetical protein